MFTSSNNIDIVLYTNRNIAFLDQSIAIIAAALHARLQMLEHRINSSPRKWVRKYRPVCNRFDKFRFENHRLEMQRPPSIVCCFSTATSIEKPSDIYRINIRIYMIALANLIQVIYNFSIWKP